VAEQDLEAIINKLVQDERTRMAMKAAAAMESGWQPGKGWAQKNPNAPAYGPFQIYLPAHRGVTPEQANDPEFAVRYMLPTFQEAVRRVPDAMWQQNPVMAAVTAAYYAEKPERFYTPQQQQSAASALGQPLGQAGGASPLFPDPFGTQLDQIIASLLDQWSRLREQLARASPDDATILMQQQSDLLARLGTLLAIRERARLSPEEQFKQGLEYFQAQVQAGKLTQEQAQQQLARWLGIQNLAQQQTEADVTSALKLAAASAYPGQRYYAGFEPGGYVQDLVARVGGPEGFSPASFQIQTVPVSPQAMREQAVQTLTQQAPTLPPINLPPFPFQPGVVAPSPALPSVPSQPPIQYLPPNPTVTPGFATGSFAADRYYQEPEFRRQPQAQAPPQTLPTSDFRQVMLPSLAPGFGTASPLADLQGQGQRKSRARRLLEQISPYLPSIIGPPLPFGVG
jgi:hypothetical protein